MLDSSFFNNKAESISLGARLAFVMMFNRGKFVVKNDSKIDEAIDDTVDVIKFTFVASLVRLVLFNSDNCESMNGDDNVDVIGNDSVLFNSDNCGVAKRDDVEFELNFNNGLVGKIDILIFSLVICWT